MSKVAKALWVSAGLVCLALGTVGVFLPILPTVPLYLLAAFCLAKGSERLNRWFVGTKLYKSSVAPLRAGVGMTMRAKVGAMTAITALLVFAFIMMSRVPWARWILVAVEAFHVWLFFFHIRTATPAEMSDWKAKNL